MNCPRCKTPLAPVASPDSIVTCPGCGSRLIPRSAAQRSQVAKPAAVTSQPPAPQPVPPAAPTTAGGTGAAAGQAPARRADGAASQTALLEQLLGEVKAVRATQHRALQLLEGLRQTLTSQASPLAAGGDALADFPIDDDSPPLAPIRAQRRKSVLLVDDDERTRQAAVAELQRCDVPVRAFDDGRAAISAIAEEKPDVNAVELAVGGEMGGKDLVNLVKATMEWVHIPIVLWTREAIASQKEARQIHGADELVLKSAGAVALVARVINVFRRQ